MKVTLITVGSRGDTEPFCAAADEFLSAGYEVDFFVQPDYKHLVRSGCCIHLLPFTSMDFYKYVGNPSHGADHPNPRVRFLGVVTDCIGELVLPCWKDLAGVETDFILTSALARSLAFAVAAKKSIPVGLIHLQPLVPTSLFPHYSRAEDCVKALVSTRGTIEEEKKEENLEAHVELEQYQYDFLAERLEPVYKGLEMEPISFSQLKLMLTGHDSKTLILNAFSCELIPPLTDVGSNVYEIGSLADSYIPKGWKPPADLMNYLEKTKSLPTPPICIGYGSMPVANVQNVVDALKETDSYAIVVGDAFQSVVKDEDALTKERIFVTSSVPYAWLLPKCGMMLSHGGAGVVMATLKAGIPAVISPLMGDQFFWVSLLEARGLGVRAGTNLSSIGTSDLVSGIEKARACYDKCQSLKETLSTTPSGPETLLQLIETRVLAHLE